MGQVQHKHTVGDEVGGAPDPHIQIDMAPLLIFPIFTNPLGWTDIHLPVPILPWNPFRTSTMLSFVVIWMAFNLIGVIVMIFMIDIPGNGFFGSGTIGRLQSAAMRWMTMGAIGTNLRTMHSHYKPDGSGGWTLEKQVGGAKKNKFKVFLYIYLILLLASCFVIGLVFPKSLKETFIGGATMSVPLSNMANLPGSMNSNIGDFTDFIKSRHETTTADAYTMSKSHINQKNQLMEYNDKINKGLQILDDIDYHETETVKKISPSKFWGSGRQTETWDFKFINSDLNPKERKSKEYIKPCGTDTDCISKIREKVFTGSVWNKDTNVFESMDKTAKANDIAINNEGKNYYD